MSKMINNQLIELALEFTTLLEEIYRPSTAGPPIPIKQEPQPCLEEKKKTLRERARDFFRRLYSESSKRQKYCLLDDRTNRESFHAGENEKFKRPAVYFQLHANQKLGYIACQ
jgi:hypothetical protein